MYIRLFICINIQQNTSLQIQGRFNIHIDSGKQGYRHTGIHAPIHAYRHIVLKAYMHTGIHAYRHTVIQAYMHTGI